uniref:Uncharacterized protein n=1 Tax=Acrobeloides nanus TaxID=290746 RepID=A0A914CGP2_9BILA
MSNKSMSMTFSEDDLRTRSSHTSTTKPRQIVVRDKIPRTPPSRVATPKSNSQILSEERRRQISEILAEEERLQKKRKEEKKIQEEEELKKSQLKALEESRLKWENEILQNRMNELKLKENQQDSKLVIRPKSSSKPALEIAPFRKTKYRRFSDKKYYNWPSEEEEMHEIDVEDPTQEIFVTNPHDEWHNVSFKDQSSEKNVSCVLNPFLCP